MRYVPFAICRLDLISGRIPVHFYVIFSDNNVNKTKRKAQPLLRLSRVGDTMETVKLRDTKYKTAFLNDRFRMRKSKQNDKAIEDLQSSIDDL